MEKVLVTPIKTANQYKIEHFTTDQVKAIIKNRMMVVALDHNRDSLDLSIPIDKIAGRVLDFKEQDGVIVCEWVAYKTSNGKEGKKLAKKGSIRPIGVGSIKEGVVQDDYILLHVVIQK